MAQLRPKLRNIRISGSVAGCLGLDGGGIISKPRIGAPYNHGSFTIFLSAQIWDFPYQSDILFLVYITSGILQIVTWLLLAYLFACLLAYLLPSLHVFRLLVYLLTCQVFFFC